MLLLEPNPTLCRTVCVKDNPSCKCLLHLAIDPLLGNTQCPLLKQSQSSLLFFKGCTLLQVFLHLLVSCTLFNLKCVSKGKMDVLFVQIQIFEEKK